MTKECPLASPNGKPWTISRYLVKSRKLYKTESIMKGDFFPLKILLTMNISDIIPWYILHFIFRAC